MADVWGIYALDGITLNAIPQPISSSIAKIPRGFFADGTERVARKRSMTWGFLPMTEAEYLTLLNAVPTNGVVKVRTWWPAEGSVAGYFADCTAIMSPLPQASNNRGRYEGVTITFTQVALA